MGISGRSEINLRWSGWFPAGSVQLHSEGTSPQSVLTYYSKEKTNIEVNHLPGVCAQNLEHKT